MKKHISLIILILFSAVFVHAQEQKREKKEDEGKKGAHQLSFMLSHSYISEGYIFGSKNFIIAPSFAIDYNYWFKNNWAIGLHTDLIKENFVLEEISGDKNIERSTPLAIVPALSYKAGKHSVFVLGMGGEFAKEGNLALTRLGYEYGWELPKNYEFSLGLSYDLKWNAYNTWTFGMIIAKNFH
jgi:hypothetical protein